MIINSTHILSALLLLIVAYPVCRLLRKMGHSAWLAVFFLIPFINVVMLYILAKATWPIEYEIEALKLENEKLRQKNM